MQKLSNIFQNIKYEILQSNKNIENIEIKDFHYDSRKLSENDMFICIKGLQSDGHDFVPMAIQKGAKVIVCENDLLCTVSEDIVVIKVADTRKSLAEIASIYYGEAWKKLDLVGVTGTNGKTTITYLVQSILDLYDKKTGVIGTIENKIGDRVIKTERTTPESRELQELFSDMVNEDVTHCVMEVSSHALDLHRVASIDFEVGVFTNLSQDHLDYHETMENYKEAKSILFKNSKKSVINIDDNAGEFMKSMAKGEVITYSIDNPSDLQAKNIEFFPNGSKFELAYKGESFCVDINTSGRFSVYNALGAIGACLSLGVPMDIIIKGLKNNQGVAGRFQSVISENGVQIVVDYAHTPDGLENVLKTAKEFVVGNIISVFGCGGDRDRTKRPLMGEVGGNNSDFVIITSDNPRTENPESIAKDVEEGVLKTGVEYEVILDRKNAITKAIAMAKNGDFVMVAGKGHENYQIFHDRTIDFDDMEEVKNVLKN